MNGVINILKPPGMTSHDVVSFIRKVSKIKKVGHTGTLDPGAAGVLPICIGNATKVVDFIMEDRKTYICELTLGSTTDTYDRYSELKHRVDASEIKIDKNSFLKVLENFKGEIEQKPPAYSAIKINGVRSYELARQGKEVDIPSRKVTIHNIDVVKFTPPTIMLKIICSKGTYIRSICNDIGEVLGFGGYMSFLLRSSTGKFNLENSCIMDELNSENIKDYIYSADYALDMDSIFVEAEYSKKLMNGNTVLLNSINAKKRAGLYRIYITPDRFIGIGEIKNKSLKMEKLMI